MTDLERAARDWLKDRDVQGLPKHLPEELVQDSAVVPHQAEFWAFIAGAKWAFEEARKAAAWSAKAEAAHERMVRRLAGERGEIKCR